MAAESCLLKVIISIKRLAYGQRHQDSMDDAKVTTSINKFFSSQYRKSQTV